VRVGDLAAHDADHVGLARGDYVVGVVGRADVAFGLDAGVADRLLEGGGERHAVLVLVHDGRDQLAEVEIAAGAAGDVVHQSAFVMIARDLLQLLERKGDLDVGVDTDSKADDEVLARVFSDALDHLGRKTHAVFEAAAPAVVAPVRPGRPELLDQGMVRGEQLDPVETAVLGPPRSLRKGLDQLLDLRLADGVAAVGIVIGRLARGRPVGLEGGVRVAVLADVIDLVDHHRAVLVAGLGDGPEGRDDGVVLVAEVAPCQDPGAMGGYGLDHDHRGASTCPLGVVAQVPRAGQAVLGHVRGVGAEHDAVLQRRVPQGERRQQVREGFAGHGPLSGFPCARHRAVRPDIIGIGRRRVDLIAARRCISKRFRPTFIAARGWQRKRGPRTCR
jgi:hypothetical protein